MAQADREKWDARYRQGGEASLAAAFLTACRHLLPARGRALDVAGGAGRNAVWLARHGLDVTVADISEVGLELARAAAAAAGVRLSTTARDLDVDPLPEGPFDVVLSSSYLRRALIPRFAHVLAPGGLLIYMQPTRSNLTRHARPPEGFLLDDGELATILAGLPVFEIVSLEEGWFEDQGHVRHEARLVARRR